MAIKRHDDVTLYTCEACGHTTVFPPDIADDEVCCSDCMQPLDHRDLHDPEDPEDPD